MRGSNRKTTVHVDNQPGGKLRFGPFGVAVELVRTIGLATGDIRGLVCQGHLTGFRLITNGRVRHDPGRLAVSSPIRN